ncbi:hypothetical protein ACFHYQ_01100 [Sphaerimonospora cavernae]|uniref:Uncharacterized protein n=1 Tax=Sphaerimonospora cavernae TaxID=1740611 RepID=A0ABV6TXG3_9ACTN
MYQPCEQRFDRLYWLPWQGFGNGLHASTWCELVDVDESEVGELLGAMSEAGIAAWAAPRPMPPRLRLRAGAPAQYRVWVDTWMHALAEDIAGRELYRLHCRKG